MARTATADRNHRGTFYYFSKRGGWEWALYHLKRRSAVIRFYSFIGHASKWALHARIYENLLLSFLAARYWRDKQHSPMRTGWNSKQMKASTKPGESSCLLEPGACWPFCTMDLRELRLRVVHRLYTYARSYYKDMSERMVMVTLRAGEWFQATRWIQPLRYFGTFLSKEIYRSR